MNHTHTISECQGAKNVCENCRF